MVTRRPAEVPGLHGDVGADLPAERPGVEAKCLVWSCTQNWALAILIIGILLGCASATERNPTNRLPPGLLETCGSAAGRRPWPRSAESGRSEPPAATSDGRPWAT